MSDVLPAPVPVITAEIARLLTENGPLTGDDLRDALRVAGVPLGGDPDGVLDDVLEAEERVQSLLDDRLAWLPNLLEGRVFTHRLTARELEHDLLVVDPDLSPLSMLTEDPRYHQLVDGSPVIEVLRAAGGRGAAPRGWAGRGGRLRLRQLAGGLSDRPSRGALRAGPGRSRGGDCHREYVRAGR